MKLSHHHRRALVSALKEALEKKDTLNHIGQSEAAKNDLSFAESIEIDDFLNNERIKLIEASLCDEEINH